VCNRDAVSPHTIGSRSDVVFSDPKAARIVRWVESVARARWLVAGLGESASPPWWRSQALTPIGGRMLERLFPRTVVSARLETATRSAAAEHDAHIGRHGSYHLFRLPISDEATLRDFLKTAAGHDCLEDLASIEGAAERLEALAQLSGDEPPSPGPGAVHCGAPRSLRQGRALARVCATYRAAFTAGSPTYPYLEEQSA
jgi:hypothetical protein